jgi:hypothetical protein
LPADTTSKQNTVIWSVTGIVFVSLLGIIGWLINGKDTALTVSINNLVSANNAAIEKSEKSDAKMLDAFNKLCDRVGGVESRVGNLEIYIQMPFTEREKYLFKTKK